MKIIYYQDFKTLFYCQDKNASTSLVTLFKQLVKTEPEIYWDHSTRRPSPPEYRDELMQRETHFQFTVVRNTWDRLSSLFHMLQRQMQMEFPGSPKGRLNPWFDRFEPALRNCLSADQPFDQFIKYICAQEDAEMDSHWQPQTTHLPQSDDLFVGRFERLGADLAHVLRRIGVPPIQLPVSENRTVHLRKHFSEDYTVESSARVADRYEEEIQRFGFQFISQRSVEQPRKAA